VRDILTQIYAFAILHGEKVANPADNVGPASIATFTPKDRALSPTEIRMGIRQVPSSLADRCRQRPSVACIRRKANQRIRRRLRNSGHRDFRPRRERPVALPSVHDRCTRRIAAPFLNARRRVVDCL
jgi:hypothetical protein